MADQSQLRFLLQGVEAWNEWIEQFEQNPKPSPSSLPTVNLSGANLLRADLSGAKLGMVNLSRANLFEADLSDAEWNYIEPHLPAPKGHGRPRTHSLREILNAIFYLLKSGCQEWRLLPHDFPTDGPPSITTSENGASMVPGSGSTGLSENACEYA